MTRVLLAALLAPAVVGAQVAPSDTSLHIAFGGFVDSYYAWDSGRPPTFDRSFAGGTPFTTQPARHNEFNVNLAFIEAKVEGAAIRGRVALQAGTSVQSNYAGEPAIGQVSGPSLARHLQEAVAGVRLADGLWVDAGLFFSHMGMEGWISRDNLTYTRSLVAEYSPYYQSGTRVTWAALPEVSVQLDVVNGWQNIAENNSGKGVGVRLDVTPAPGATLSYYNFLSDEAGNRLRTFNGFGARFLAGRSTLLGQIDVGTQARSTAADGTASWYGFTAVARVQATEAVGLAARIEAFDDRYQVVAATGLGTAGTANPPLRATGASVGVDVSPQRRVVWRIELRGFRNRQALFPDGRATGARTLAGVAVTSLALTF